MRDLCGGLLDRLTVGHVHPERIRFEIEDGHPRAALFEPADDLAAELTGAPGHDRHAIREREEITHERWASQTRSQNSRTQPSPPERESTSEASGLTSGHASAGTTGSPT